MPIRSLQHFTPRISLREIADCLPLTARGGRSGRSRHSANLQSREVFNTNLNTAEDWCSRRDTRSNHDCDASGVHGCRSTSSRCQSRALVAFQPGTCSAPPQDARHIDDMILVKVAQCRSAQPAPDRLGPRGPVPLRACIAETVCAEEPRALPADRLTRPAATPAQTRSVPTASNALPPKPLARGVELPCLPPGTRHRTEAWETVANPAANALVSGAAEGLRGQHGHEPFAPLHSCQPSPSNTTWSVASQPPSLPMPTA